MAIVCQVGKQGAWQMAPFLLLAVCQGSVPHASPGAEPVIYYAGWAVAWRARQRETMILVCWRWPERTA